MYIGSQNAISVLDYKTFTCPRHRLEVVTKSDIFDTPTFDGAITVQAIKGGTPPYQFIWKDLNTSDKKLVNLEAGSYKYIITDADDCMTEGAIQIKPFSIRESNIITIFPNPTQDFFNIRFLKIGIDNYDINILNTSGIVVKSLSLKNILEIEKIDISDLAGGYYVLQIKTQSEIQNLPFVKATK